MATPTAAVNALTQEHIRRFFETHLGPLPYRDQVSTRCKFHDDHSPSLSIHLEKGVWKCHAGCGGGGLLDFQLKLTPGADRQTACRLVNEACGANVFGGRQPEAIYHYTDAQGLPLFQKLRYRDQSGEKYFIYRHWTPEGYVKGADGIAKPLYNLPAVLTANEIFVTEGEKNADDLLRALGPVVQEQDEVHVAVTTSHAGAGCWSEDYNPYFLDKRVVILADNDKPGRQHAQQVAAALYPIASGVKIVDLSGLEEGGDVSDYLNAHTVTDLLDEARNTKLWRPASSVPVWRTAFKSYEQLDEGELEFLIDKVVPHGITFFGGLSGVGKTWFALSAVKAIIGGQNFLRKFRVPHPLSVIYLVPEAGERAFRCRLQAMKLTVPEDQLLCRPMGGEATLSLTSPELLEAIRTLKPVVVLDTAIRFSTAEDENSSAQNQKLANEMFGLLSAGAKGILAIHHSAKNATKDGPPTLENTLRGTGDLGAIADSVYNLRCEDMRTLTVNIECVKSRDFEPPAPFQIQGRPYIDQLGDFVLVAQPTDEELVVKAICEAPNANVREIAAATRISVNRVTKIANSVGWKKDGKIWVQDSAIVQ